MFALETMTKAKLSEVAVLSQKNREPGDNPGVALAFSMVVPNGHLSMFDGALRGFLYTKSAASSDGEAKPVAWAWGRRDVNGEVYDCISDAEHSLNEGKYTVPLYTSPPQQEQVIPMIGSLVAEQAVPGAVQDGWQPIETAKKSGHDVLLYTSSSVRLGFWDEPRGGVWSIWPGREPAFPSHWMPLPAAPKAQEPGA